MSLRAVPDTADGALRAANAGSRRWWGIALLVAVVGLAGLMLLSLQERDDAVNGTLAEPAHATLRAPASSGARDRDRLALPPDPVSALASGELSFEQLTSRVRVDADVRGSLWARYRAESNPEHRQTLLALLAEAPVEVVAEYVALLIGDSDVERRRDGYRLLSGLPIEQAALREQALRGLRQEVDAAALAELVQGLQPGMLPIEDAQPLADTLQSLAQTGDPAVRAAALPGLSAWADATHLESTYLGALGHADARVRAAAIAGIEVARLSTPNLRLALFQFAANAAETTQDRHAALLALSRFRLSRAEVELYRMLQAEVPVDPPG